MITFSTCWYSFKNKNDTSTYESWMDNMLSNVHNYNLVIYSNESSCSFLLKYLQNPKIKLIIKPHTNFLGYKHKDFWIENHKKNHLLNTRIDWEVNMLWCEKINFVHETIQNKYFDTPFYGWCDIGYFRNKVVNWPSTIKINNLSRHKIHYACVNNNDEYINNLYSLILNKNTNGLPLHPIPPDQVSIAGGFFIGHKDKIQWWKNTFYSKLQLYVDHAYLVKDDQMVLVDCIFSENTHFTLYKENNGNDNWFMFQRLLS
jgi:hypothetical protein